MSKECDSFASWRLSQKLLSGGGGGRGPRLVLLTPAPPPTWPGLLIPVGLSPLDQDNC